MAVLVYSELSDLFLDRVQANVTTDPPFTAAQIARFLNSAYAMIWEVSGGRMKTVASATAWTSAQTATGVVTGILTDVDEVLHAWASTVSGSVGVSAGDIELDRKELSYINWLRSQTGTGTYLTPKSYAVSRPASIVPGSVNLLRLDYWPPVTGFYLPIAYTPQFTPIDSVTVTTPDVNDLESRDIPLVAAVQAAPLLGRAELVPSIMADLSDHTRATLERRMSSMIDSKQDNAA